MSRPETLTVVTLTLGSQMLALPASALREILDPLPTTRVPGAGAFAPSVVRSEEHTSELQSHHELVCRLLLDKKRPLTMMTNVTELVIFTVSGRTRTKHND